MPQNFFKPVSNATFVGKRVSELVYACYADEFITRSPRVMHSHQDLAELVLICAGGGVHHIDNRVYNTRRGDLILYNSGSVHDESVVDEGQLESYGLGIRNLKFAGLPLNHFLPAGFCPVVVCGNYFDIIFTLLREIYRQSEQPRVNEAAECAGYLMQALLVQVEMLVGERMHPLEQEAYSLGLRVREYIDASYMEEINLGIIAQAVGASVYYLSHSFKILTGYSPMQYVTRRRIGEAQNLLIGTAASITSIAMQVGYSDSNYFQNVFRSIVGLTPGQYRRQWQTHQQ